MLACSVEELEVDKCRRAGWRSGTSFRGASSFSAEKLVSKSLSQSTILPRLATNCLCLCRDQICFRNCPAARLPERGGARRPRLPHDDVMSQIHREQGRGGGKHKLGWRETTATNHQPSSVTMTFAARHLQLSYISPFAYI